VTHSPKGLTPRLTAPPTHELELARTYRTIFMCGVFGIGGRRRTVEPKDPIAGMGWYAVMADSEGNERGLFERRSAPEGSAGSSMLR
jgi:hypothetical protein